MSGSRTLVRKLKVDRDRRAKPEHRPLKRGTVNRHVVWTVTDGVHETYLHATKGVRRRLVA